MTKKEKKTHFSSTHMQLHTHLHAGSLSHLFSIGAPRSEKVEMPLLSSKCIRWVNESSSCNKGCREKHTHTQKALSAQILRSEKVSYLTNERNSAYFKIHLTL